VRGRGTDKTQCRRSSSFFASAGAARAGEEYLVRTLLPLRPRAAAPVQAALALRAGGHTARSGADRRAAPAATGLRSEGRYRRSPARIPAYARYPADTGSNTACAFPPPESFLTHSRSIGPLLKLRPQQRPYRSHSFPRHRESARSAGGMQVIVVKYNGPGRESCSRKGLSLTRGSAIIVLGWT
jgi:hypothetical protein